MVTWVIQRFLDSDTRPGLQEHILIANMPNHLPGGREEATLWTEGTSAQGQRGGAYLRAQSSTRSRGGRGQTTARRKYQTCRVEEFREKSNATVEALSREFRDKLMPGVRDATEAVKSKE